MLRLITVILLRQPILAIFLLSLAATAFAQTVIEEMTSDRPGFRNSTHLVGPGVLQFENGARLFQDRAATGGSMFAMEPAMRFGVVRALELRLSTETVILRSPKGGEDAIAGISDMEAGIKVPVFSRTGTRVVSILKTALPTGHVSQTSRGYQPGAEVIWEQEMPRDYSLAGTWNLTRVKDENGFVWQRAASVALNHDITQKMRAFGEVYVISPVERGAGNQWVADAAVTRTVGQYVAVDGSAGVSVHGPRAWFVMIGISVRNRTPWRISGD